MANVNSERCRLCLVTPPDDDATAAALRVADGLSGGDVASLIVTVGRDDPRALQEMAEAVVPIAQARGVAALIHNDIRVAKRARADGVHVDSGPADLEAALATFHPGGIVGVGGVATRHAAVTAGELQPDYVFFGRLDGDTEDGIFPKALDLAEWWSAVTVVPAVVMGGRAIASVRQAAAAGIAFVALAHAVWDDPRGPALAVAEANAHLAAAEEPVT